MKHLLKEPLLHFLILGAVVFAVYSQVSKRASSAPGKIVITQGEIESMMVGFTRTWQRPPNSDELEGLIRDRVQEEVYCREAMALGLDKDDTIIRRRLRQKMEFVSDDIVAQVEPTDADLTVYLQAHPDSFRVEQRITFSQVYFNPEKHGDNMVRDVAQQLAELNRIGGKADASALGDSFLLEHEFAALPRSEIANQFGEKFATKLCELSLGRWQIGRASCRE